jgi:FkbM family methyltransferase
MQLTKINGKYELFLPEHRAMRPEWKIENGGWEVSRIEAMLQRITKRDVVFDIGTEEGDISALIAKYTGCQMVLFEPNDRVWSCLKATWEANDLFRPLEFFSGFIGSVGKEGVMTEWDDIKMDELIVDHGFKQLYESYPSVPVARLDDWCVASGTYPTVITMDVEGSEFEVIKGAKEILREHSPLIFMSIHGAFMHEHYGQHIGDMLKFIHDCGYRHEVIELDYHELHVLFEPKATNFSML